MLMKLKMLYISFLYNSIVERKKINYGI